MTKIQWTDLITVTQTIKEVQDALRCRCEPEYLKRGTHAPNCKDYLVDELQDVVNLLFMQQEELSIITWDAAGDGLV